MMDEVHRLTDEMKLAGENFSRERETTKKEYARKESEQALLIQTLKESSSAKDAKISEQSESITALISRITALQSEIETLQKKPETPGGPKPDDAAVKNPKAISPPDKSDPAKETGK
jgi:chromosome segregation ATPase